MLRIFNFLLILFFLNFPVLTNAEVQENCKNFNYLTASEKKITLIKIKTNNYRSWQVNNIRILTDNTNVISDKFKRKFLSEVIVFYEDNTFCKIQAKIRTHGDLKDHIYFKDGKVYQSLDVQLIDGHINNITKFKLFLKGTRGNEEDEIFMTELLRQLGFLAPRTEAIKVQMNDTNIKMLFQEKITKELLEYNYRREGPILEGDEKYMWSYASKIENKVDGGIDWNEIFRVSELGTRIQLSKQSNSSWAIKDSEFLKDSLMALEKLNFAYLVYLNSYKEKHTFLDYDLDNLILSSNNEQQRQKLNLFNNLIIAAKGYHGLYTHNRRFYWNSIERYFEPIYYDGEFNITEKINKLNFPLSLDYEKSINKTKLILNNIDKKDFFENKIKKKLNISYKNYLLKFDVLINNLEDIKKLFLEKNNEDLKANKFIYESINLTENYLDNINNLKEDIKFVKFLPNINDEKFYLCLNNLNDCNNKIYLDENEIRKLLEGDLNLENKNYQFIGFKENYGNEYKSIILNDENFDNVNFYYKGNFSFNYEKNNFEIFQNETLGRSYFVGGKIKNVEINFNGSNKFFNQQVANRLDYRTLTGCVTFYNLSFENVKISSNYSNCEDAINIINSVGKIKIIKSKNSLFDGIDIDFSNIEVNEVNVKNSLNDCIDFSSGKYFLNKGTFENCGDKGISIGEKSFIKISEANILDSNIGIASKDSSKAIINKVSVNNSDICLSAYNKKQEFSGGYLKIESANCQNFNKKLFYDNFSQIEIN